MAFREVEKRLKEFLILLKFRAEQVKIESRREEWKRLLEGIGRLGGLGQVSMGKLKSPQRKKRKKKIWQ